MPWMDVFKLSIPLVAVAGLFYTIMNTTLRSLGDSIREEMKRIREDMNRIEGKVDNLGKDHNFLARELSELKGYLRRTPPESVARNSTAQ